MSGLTREQIRARNLSRVIAVPVPEWDGEVFVRTLSPAAGMELGDRLKDKPAAESLAIQLAAFLCDAQGEALYTIEQARAELVDSGLAKPMQRILERALAENGMGDMESVKGNS